MNLTDGLLLEAIKITGIGVWEWLPESDAFSWCPSCAAIYGDWSVGPSRLDAFMDRVHSDDRARVRGEIESTLVTGGEFTSDFRIFRTDGTVRWLTCRGTYLARDGVVRVLGTLLDISERRHAEILLQQVNAILNTINDSTPALIAVKDVEGRITYCNPAVLNLVQQPASALLGRTDVEYLGEENGRPIMDHDAEVMRSRRSQMFEEPAGGRIFQMTKAPYVDAEGRLLGLIAVGVDITERRREEEDRANAARRQREELERAVVERTESLQRAIEELEAFSYSVAHDLRGPLRSVHYFAEAIAEADLQAMSPKCAEHLQRLRQAVVRMDRLIVDVLNYSKVARGALGLEPISLSNLVASVVAVQADPFCKAKISIREPLPTVLGHEAMLGQAVGNLLSNALRFAKPGETPVIDIWATEQNGNVRLHIRDHGIGIAPEHHARIFELFEQVKPDGCGTGIGLAIVRKAVDRMNGTVGLESAPGKGSTFWIELSAS